ncbi:MAG: S41 family peptidase [Fibrobacter sp.]|nr:S41 family peptidase [Fibrobacter sp.]
MLLLTSCSDFFSPVKSTDSPTEYQFNYWLLQRAYLYEDELGNLPEEGDSVQVLYDALSDPYTRYAPPSKSEDVEISINTSFVPGDVGMEYLEYFVEGSPEISPILIYRVYPNSPAAKAGVPRYGRILSVNGVQLFGEDARYRYDSVLTQNAELEMRIFYGDSIKTYSMTKEDVYAPTLFLDTAQGITFITITEFKLTTADQANGTLGELRTYLDSTKNETGTRVLDLRNNPGGHISQCVGAADMFIPKGTLSTRYYITFAPDGERTIRTVSMEATAGDPGESGDFVILDNHASASCAEIFIAAMKEIRHTPIIGSTTYGKGIGQSSWKTIDDGLAIITNLEILTPLGNTYHKKGIEPDLICASSPSRQCAIDYLGKSQKDTTIKEALSKKSFPKAPIDFIEGSYFSKKKTSIGGAIAYPLD